MRGTGEGREAERERERERCCLFAAARNNSHHVSRVSQCLTDSSREEEILLRRMNIPSQILIRRNERIEKSEGPRGNARGSFSTRGAASRARLRRHVYALQTTSGQSLGPHSPH